MRLKQYLIEKRIQPISADKFTNLLQKEIANKVSTKDRYKKSLEIGEYKDISFSQWKEFDADSNFHTSRITEDSIELSIRKFIIDLIHGDIEKVLNDISKKYGYYLSYSSTTSLNFNYFRFRKFYGEILEKIPKKLYHFSHSENEKRILSKGLIPKKGEIKIFQYPPSVFLATDLKAVKNLLFPDGDPYTIFEIDTNKLKKGTKFFIDPDAPNSIRTFTHIPPQAIKKLKTVTDTKEI